MKRSLVLLAVIVLALALAACAAEETTEPISETSPVGQEADEGPAEAAELPLKKRLRAALDGARDGLTKFSWDGKAVTATYDISDDSFWDENALIRNCAVDTVDALGAAFAFSEVRRVNVIFLIEMTDEFGSAEKEEGVKIDWTRALWKNVEDPDAFKDRLMGSDETLMYKLATLYYVHPGIWKNTKLSEEGMGAMGGER